MTTNISGTRRMLGEKQVLEIIPVARSTLLRMEKAGRFPRSTYISPNRRVWFEDEIVGWQNAVDEFNPNRGRGKGRRARVAAK
jgi:prophage regulatory protein